MSDDPLQQLVQEGRDLNERDRAHHEDAAVSNERDANSETLWRLRRSVSSFARWSWWLIGGASGVAVALLVGQLVLELHTRPAPRALAREDESDVAGLFVMLAGAVPFFAVYLLRPRVGDHAIAREEAWARSFPFRIHGYPQVLGHSTTEGTAGLVLRFASATKTVDNPAASFRTPGARVATLAAPDDETLSAVFRTIGAKLSTSTRQDGTKRITYEVSFGDTSVFNNAHLAEWIHRASNVLMTLHARHPIEEVRVEGFR
jgi:hypothetical protein